MSLLDLCPASYDECFSSWVYRCKIKFPWVKFVLEDDGVDKEHGEYREVEYEDPDFDVNSAFVKSVVLKLGLAANDYLPFFEIKPGKVLPFKYRRFYCSICMKENIEQNILPCWSKEWCYSVSTFCLKHKKKLSFGRFLYPHIGRAWHAFSESTNGSCIPHGGSRQYALWEDDGVQEYIYQLSSQVLEWYWAEEKNLKWEGTCNARVESFDLILRLLTQAPCPLNSGGISWLFTFSHKIRLGRYRRDYSWLLENGVNEVDINQRACGVILAGKILGVLAKDQVARLNHMVGDLFPYFDHSSLELGFASANYRSMDDYNYLLSRFDQLPCSFQENLHGFIVGLQPEA
ncbi:hypothetical protein SAMN05216603_101524 [Pseudomonas benzenivorans]|nr:hypothetical protein [Pseudomonas benzenivorans]SDG39001.1 hypothetical protein SAMN05216603_101524 [Pseudomonas benzenivorans]